MKQFFSILIVGSLLMSPAANAAEDVSADACRTEVNEALAKEQRLYRSVLFGSPSAEDAHIKSLKFDKDGKGWIKVSDNSWKNPEEKDDLSNEDMDNQSELEERKGIFATRGVLTSELVPSLTQSIRALQCRIEITCATARASIGAKGSSPENITLSIPGCIDTEKDDRSTFPGCHLTEGKESVPAESDLLSYCDAIGQDMFTQEISLLKMAVEYDAAYRSLLQFAGGFDQFLGEWRQPLTQTIRTAARLLGSFRRIPCFSAACDASPPEEK
jgi:hypothetical protein